MDKNNFLVSFGDKNFQYVRNFINKNYNHSFNWNALLSSYYGVIEGKVMCLEMDSSEPYIELMISGEEFEKMIQENSNPCKIEKTTKISNYEIY